MNPAFLLGTAFKIAYWHRKYHSGTICKGVSNPQTSNALSGCEKEEIPKWVCIFSVKQPKENNLCFADVSNSKREDLEEEDQRQDERNVIL